MPLEFALRPRFNLERPVPRRRVVRKRFLRLALPIAGYWLAIAGVTHAFLRSAAEERGAQAPALENAELAATDPAEPPETEPEIAAAEIAPAPETAPAPDLAAPPAPAAADTEQPLAALPSLTATIPTTEPAPLPPVTTPKALTAPPPPPDFMPRRAPAVRSDPPRPADPPRIARAEPRLSDPLFALAPPEDEPTASAAPPPRADSAKDEARAFALPTCEAAAAASNETIDMEGSRGAPDLSRDTFASVLENGVYLNRCEIPARTALDICAAVQNGKVVGLSVSSNPRSPHINACVRRAVSSLRFPSNARLDITRTRFEPAR